MHPKPRSHRTQSPWQNKSGGVVVEEPEGRRRRRKGGGGLCAGRVLAQSAVDARADVRASVEAFPFIFCSAAQIGFLGRRSTVSAVATSPPPSARASRSSRYRLYAVVWRRTVPSVDRGVSRLDVNFCCFFPRFPQALLGGLGRRWSWSQQAA